MRKDNSWDGPMRVHSGVWRNGGNDGGALYMRRLHTGDIYGSATPHWMTVRFRAHSSTTAARVRRRP